MLIFDGCELPTDIGKFFPIFGTQVTTVIVGEVWFAGRLSGSRAVIFELACKKLSCGV
jgi:hypothetical protein